MKFGSSIFACAVLVLASAASAADAVREPATPDEINSGNGLGPGQVLSPDGRWLAINTGKGPGFIDLETGEALNAGSYELEEYWNLVDRTPYSYWAPDSSVLAVPLYKNGRSQMALWTPPKNGKPQEIKSKLILPRDLNFLGTAAWAPDGRTFYFSVYQFLPWPRSFAEDDFPPSEGPNVKLKMTRPYDDGIERPRFPKEYPEAYAEGVRCLVLAYDVASGRIGMIAKGNDIRAIHVSPNGKRLLVVQSKSNMPDKETLWTGQVYNDVYLFEVPKVDERPTVDFEKFDDRKAGWWDHRGQRARPLVTDLLANSTEPYDPLAAADGNNGNLTVNWAPDSQGFVYATTGREATGDVYLFDIATRKERNLTEKIALPESSPKTLGYSEYAVYKFNSRRFGNLYPPLWAKDGKSVYLISRGEVWNIPLDSTPARMLSSELPLESRRVMPGMDERMALLDREGNLLIVARERVSRLDSLWKLNPATGHAGKIIDAGVSADVNSRTDARGEKWVFAGQSPVSGKNVYQVSLAAPSQPKRVTEFKTELPDRLYPDTRVMEFKTPGGKTGFALLYLPANRPAAGKVPMILSGYPGIREGQLDLRALSGASFFSETAYSLLEQGFAVLIPDIPLSQEGTYENPMKQTTEGVLAATQAALDTGLIDKDKLGIMGSSYGGYMALAVVTQTNMFKAAVSLSGLSDMVGNYLGDSVYGPRWSEVGQGRMQVPLWEAPANYTDSSPLFYLNKVQTPLLLMHGEKDMVVPIIESAKAFRGLKRAKHTVIFASYRRLEHEENSETRQRVNLWFREHLLGEKSLSNLADQKGFFIGGQRAQDKRADAGGAASK